MKKIDPFEKLKKNIKTSNNSLPKNITRKVLFLKSDIALKIDNLAYWNQTSKREIINTILEKSISEIEKKNGIIPDKPEKSKFKL